GWAPVPPANLPWKDFNQLILFNLATENGPGLDASNIQNINVPAWVATVHAHPGIKAIIAIGGAGNDNWGNACSDANRAQFVQNLVGFATSTGFGWVDVDEHPQPPGGCGQFSSYAAQAGLMGAFVWDAAADARSGNACADGLAAGTPQSLLSLIDGYAK